MRKIIVLALLSTFLLSCKEQPKPSEQSPNAKYMEMFNRRAQQRYHPLQTPSPFVHSINNFGVDFYKTLAQTDSGNLVISPLSIYSMLAVLTVGAAEETRAEFVKALQCEINPDLLLDSLSRILEIHKNDTVGEYLSNFVSATAVWPNVSAKCTPSFKKTAQRNSIELIKTDFSRADKAERAIDKWASDKTDGKIEDIIDASEFVYPVGFVVTNAVTASAEWSRTFNTKETVPRTFYLNDGTRIDVPTMTGRTYQKEWTYGRFAQFAALSMKTSDTRLTMQIYLPDSGFSLKQLEKLLAADSLAVWQDSIRSAEGLLITYLPKFSFRDRQDLIPAVKSLGVNAAFGLGGTNGLGGANFSNILVEWQGFFVGLLRHAAVVTVDEKGFDAQAVSGGMVISSAKPNPPITFDANRPFFFTIVHNETGLILFCGRVMRPVLEDS